MVPFSVCVFVIYLLMMENSLLRTHIWWRDEMKVKEENGKYTAWTKGLIYCRLLYFLPLSPREIVSRLVGGQQSTSFFQ